MFERRYTYTIFAPPLFFPIIYYNMSIYRKENTLSRTLPFPPLSFRTFVYLYTLLLYTLYTGKHSPATFSRPFLYFYYTPYIYIENDTHFSRPFLPSYKVNTFTPPLSLSFWNVTYGESLREKSFWKLY